MYCYEEDCYAMRPLVAELMGSFVGLILWGEFPLNMFTGLSINDIVGLYACLFFVTLWLLRKKRSKWTFAVIGIVILFVLNLIQTGESPT